MQDTPDESRDWTAMIVYVASAGDIDGVLSLGVFSTHELAQDWINGEYRRFRYSWSDVSPMKVDDPDYDA